MVEICPFQGYRYAPDRVAIQDVVSPPYDKIPDPSVFHSRSEHNVAHLILPGPEAGEEMPARFARAAIQLDAWIGEGIFVRDSQHALYPYHQIYSIDGNSFTRRGVVALMRIEDPSRRRVRPHERTRAKPRAERLELLRAMNANLGQIFMLYRDPECRIEAAMAPFVTDRTPYQAILEGDVIHRLWAVEDSDAIVAATEVLAEKDVLIADGHHRYEVAWNYREEQLEARGSVQYQGTPGFRMVTLVNTEQEAMHVLPSHRLLADVVLPPPSEIGGALEALFSLRRYPLGGEENQARVWRDFSEDLRIEGTAGPCLGIYRSGDEELLLLVPRDREKIRSAVAGSSSEAYRGLDVVALHEVVLPALLTDPPGDEAFEYLRDGQEAFVAGREGRVQTVLFLNPPRLDQVREVAEAGERMPAKSTDFFPKLATGLVFHRFDG